MLHKSHQTAILTLENFQNPHKLYKSIAAKAVEILSKEALWPVGKIRVPDIEYDVRRLH